MSAARRRPGLKTGVRDLFALIEVRKTNGFARQLGNIVGFFAKRCDALEYREDMETEDDCYLVRLVAELLP
jgi:hypothetical protein